MDMGSEIEPTVANLLQSFIQSGQRTIPEIKEFLAMARGDSKPSMTYEEILKMSERAVQRLNKPVVQRFAPMDPIEMSSILKEYETASVAGLIPKVDLKDAVKHHKIFDIHTGEPHKSLSLHVLSLGYPSFKRYVEFWELPNDFPFVAPAYASDRYVNSTQVEEIINTSMTLNISERIDYLMNQTVLPNFLLCLETGKRVKHLRHYVESTLHMEWTHYLKKYNLPNDYPQRAKAATYTRQSVSSFEDNHKQFA